MAEWFDLNHPAGQFRALFVLYLITLGLRCWGYQFVEQDNTLIMGSLLTLLRGYIHEVKQ